MNGNPTRYGCRASAGRLGTASGSGSLCHMRFAHNNKETCRQKCPQRVPRLDSPCLASSCLVSYHWEIKKCAKVMHGKRHHYYFVTFHVEFEKLKSAWGHRPETETGDQVRAPQFDPGSEPASRWASGKMALCVIGYKHKLRGPIFSAHIVWENARLSFYEWFRLQCEI